MALPTGRSVPLGLFIVGQLVFLFSSNFLGILQDFRTSVADDPGAMVEHLAPGWTKEKGHLWDWGEEWQKLNRRWSQLTGQYQSWSLFAPAISRNCTFPALLFRWDPEPCDAEQLRQPLAIFLAHDPLTLVALTKVAAKSSVDTSAPEVRIAARAFSALAAATPWDLAAFATLRAFEGKPVPFRDFLSDNEPGDLRSFFRFGNYRLRRFESGLVINLQEYPEETRPATLERWRKEIRDHVRENAELLLAYARWRSGQLQMRRPDLPPPRQVVLMLRRYYLADPEEGADFFSGPFVEPLARWRPGGSRDAEHFPLEWYNPVTGRFVSLEK